MTKKIIKAYQERLSTYEFDGSLETIKSKIDELIATYGKDALVEFDKDHHYPYDDNPTPIYEIYVRREETDDEYNVRLQDEIKSKQAIEARERNELQRLKSKFGEK